MTELAEAPAGEAQQEITRITHWIGGKSRRGHVGAQRPGLRPRARRPDRRGRLRVRRGGGRGRRGRARRVPRLARDVAVAPRRAHVPHPRARARPPRGGCAHPHRRARQGALRRARRGGAWARGDRVRLRDPDAAQGRASRSRRRRASTSTRSASRSASSPASRRSTSRRWCPCGCGRPRSRAATPSCSSRRRRTRRRRSGRPSCSRRPACPTASSTSCTATRWRSTACSSTRTSRAVSFVGSTPIARYVYETGTKNGKRVQALGGAKNHMIVLPDADVDMAADAAVQRRVRIAPASAAWPSRRSSRSATSRTSSSRRSRRGSRR